MKVYPKTVLLVDSAAQIRKLVTHILTDFAAHSASPSTLEAARTACGFRLITAVDGADVIKMATDHDGKLM